MALSEVEGEERREEIRLNPDVIGTVSRQDAEAPRFGMRRRVLATDKNQMHTDKKMRSEFIFICVHLIFIRG
jgi:hypothetical protein